MASPFKVKSIYEYSSPHEDDLNFGIGQIITVTDEEDADWYGGEYVDDDGVKREGIFPRNFVEKYEPTAPPRPIRSRGKDKPDASHAPQESAPPPPPVHEQPTSVQQSEPEVQEADKTVHAAPAVPDAAPLKSAAPAVPKTSAAPAPASIPAPAPVPAPTKSSPPPRAKATPPPPAPKSNAFKDRIAAFNKPAAPPVAPFKPSGLSGTGTGFVKKPFVAPPPSRNAFVPPPQAAPVAKVYRREEDPEIREREAETQEQAEKAGLVPGESQEGDAEEQPKPTSLKERIALLQKQQMEQAQRHADAAIKKKKPERPPPKKRTESAEQAEASGEAEGTSPPAPPERRDTDDAGARTSIDEPAARRVPPPPRRKSSKGPAVDPVNDGNEADMSGAGDTTEGVDDVTEREDSDVASRRASHVPNIPIATETIVEEPKAEQTEQAEQDEEEEEDDVDPEVKRREELRARMAKMSGGMGFHGMFGAPPAPPPKKKKPAKSEQSPVEENEESSPVSRAAPPIPTMMALPGMGGPRKSEEIARPEEEPQVESKPEPEPEAEPATRAPPPPIPVRQATEEPAAKEEGSTTPAPTAPAVPPRDTTSPPPPVPGNRPAPPPVPSEARPPPPPPPADVKSQTEGSESDDELSGNARETTEEPVPEPLAETIQSPPMPPRPVQAPHLPMRSPPMSPRQESIEPVSPTSPASKRTSRPPPPIPGSAPLPPPVSSRPPPPPPPGRPSIDARVASPTRPPQAGEEDDDENTEYEGDYDTDIASSVPHKDALKAHARDSSLEENSLKSPVSDAPPSLPPPIPTGAPPRAVPPPVPSQPPTDIPRQSVEVPRAAPPPPPPPVAKEAPPAPPPQAPQAPPAVPAPQAPQIPQEEHDPYNYAAQTVGVQNPTIIPKTPRFEDDAYFPGSPVMVSPRAPQSAGSSRPPGTRGSLDMGRASMNNRRSMDIHRPSMSTESGFIANDIDLAVQSGWWKQSNQAPPALQGRKDVYFECEESTSTNGGQKTIITREIFVLYQDYSQTFLTIRYDPNDPSDVELEQRHEPPPRPLRQDQMEEFYERFGRPISQAVTSKVSTVVGDGTPHGLINELLRPFKDALAPVGTRAYGALVYSNMANASTQQNDMIRAGDILTIRNAKFQGKHGPMHAKYSVEVGKPDHVAVIAEWDGTKKKVRAWEQGRENKKVKVESFKLDDLRSGEVKIWRVMPRSWVGWNSQP